jgi:hypothetical protein
MQNEKERKLVLKIIQDSLWRSWNQDTKENYEKLNKELIVLRNKILGE